MKIVALLSVAVSAAVVAGCASTYRAPANEVLTGGVLVYHPVPPKESFSIGAFKPSETEYNFKHYDGGKAYAFLASVKDRFSDGDIVAVDGLKWKKEDGEWAPFPNPPVPVWNKGDDREAHFQRYARWIQDHPHFELPPLPIDGLK